ncbi:sensor histidine kinase [Granulosicoccus sp. 3-233]|uniref:sensor histidine kinase n=1 Tax=Granulosicoccus sp. 3-233 TaxID=3417969 RepID=UPI003D327D1B
MARLVGGRRQINAAEPITRLHYLMVGVSVVATIIAWQMSLAGVQERTRLQFDAQAHDVIRDFEEQMRRYEDVLHAGVGYVSGNEGILPDEWQAFTDRMDLAGRHPALNSLGVVYKVLPEDAASFELEQRRMRPEFGINPAVDSRSIDSRPYYLPVTFVAPRKLEKRALGLDAARESRRMQAIERAMDTGEVQITEPVQFGLDRDSGLLLFAPIYDAQTPDTVAQRRASFRGAVVASIFTQNLAAVVLENDSRQVSLKVSDEGQVMYDEQLADRADLDPEPMLQYSREMFFMGRVWRFEVDSTLAFRQAHQRLEPALILFGGLIINALLVCLLVYMAQANRRALDYGRKIAAKYDRQSEALQQSNATLEELNEELRSFSYVVSHDLKTPLRGIAALASCIEDDMAEQFPGLEESQPEFARRLGLIRKQVTLSQGLITGVLEYSGLGADAEIPETVNVLELLHGIRTMLGVREDQLQVLDEMPVLTTCQTQLFQVFMNLMGNGYKYHGNPEDALVIVSAVDSPKAGFHRFVVSDNGPGIDARYHERIFEVFSTLQPKDHSMSSGVGLAIVRKLVSRHGGEITIESEPGHGASFLFDWPCEVEPSLLSGPGILPKAA